MHRLSTEKFFDSDVRLAGYRFFIDRCRAPTVAELARKVSSAPSRVWTALRRLERRHALVLQEDAAFPRRASLRFLGLHYSCQLLRPMEDDVNLGRRGCLLQAPDEIKVLPVGTRIKVVTRLEELSVKQHMGSSC